MFNQSFFWDRLGISNYAIGLFQSNTKWWYAYAIGDATIHCKLGRIVWGSEAAHAEGFSHYERHLRFFRCQRPCLFTRRDWRCGPTHVQNLSPASPSDLHSGWLSGICSMSFGYWRSIATSVLDTNVSFCLYAATIAVFAGRNNA